MKVYSSVEQKHCNGLIDPWRTSLIVMPLTVVKPVMPDIEIRSVPPVCPEEKPTPVIIIMTLLPPTKTLSLCFPVSPNLRD